MIARRRQGIILILVLVVIAMLALAGLSFAELMLTEHKAARTSGRQLQARVAAQSGAEMARQFLDRQPQDQTDAGGVYDNPRRFSGVLVYDDELPQNRARFTFVAPRIEDRVATGIRNGLQDESTRINLATILQISHDQDVAKKILMGLPGMTDAIADSILDWIDADSTTRSQGAESDYYGTLSPPYAPRNAPPTTLEELLLVRGVTPQLLFGLDAARSGLTSGSASSDGSIDGVDNSDGSMNHGWASYLTLWSAESNQKSDGTAKINLNDDDLKKLYDALEKALDKDWATFIVAYRQNGPQAPMAAFAGSAASVQLDFDKKATTTLASVLDLVGASTTVKNPNPAPANGPRQRDIVLRSPCSEDTAAMSTQLPKLLDNTTVHAGATIPGRININQAPRVVLMCIPGMTQEIVDQIISKRTLDPATAATDRLHETWPLTEGIVPLKTMKELLPYITAGGSVYRAQIIGSFEKGSSSARLEVLLDATKRPTRQLFWKDLSHLPGGFPVEMLGHSESTTTN